MLGDDYDACAYDLITSPHSIPLPIASLDAGLNTSQNSHPKQMLKIDVNLIKNATKRRFQNVFEASVETAVNGQTPVFYNKEYLPLLISKKTYTDRL